ncbi:MAG: hypothetical protein HPY69_10735 [Armatimonadetes bacterium]|nr:hypothetical protein [Armatimonadota bacterium]
MADPAAGVQHLKADTGSHPAGQLGSARTPLEVVCSLTELGHRLDLDLAAMAMVTAAGPTLWLGSVAPLQPADLRAQLDHFRGAVGPQLGTQVGRLDWTDVPVLSVCVQPDAPALRVGRVCYRDRVLWLSDEARACVRLVCLDVDTAEFTERRWEEAAELVRTAVPWLRAVTTGHGHERPLICPESGAYIKEYFLDCLDREIERARRHLGELALAVLELRPADPRAELGALVHARVGGHLRAAVRRTDLVGRLGPRTYGAFFYSTGPRAALIAAGRVAEALAADNLVSSEVVFALGVSGWEITGADAESLLGQARSAAREALLIAPGRAFVYA